MQLPTSTYQFENEKVTLIDDYPMAVLKIEVEGKGAKRYASKEVTYHVKRDGSSVYTASDSNFLTLLAIRGMQKLIMTIVNTGRIQHPAHSVYEIIKAHYDNKQAKQYGK